MIGQISQASFKFLQVDCNSVGFIETNGTMNKWNFYTFT